MTNAIVPVSQNRSLIASPDAVNAAISMAGLAAKSGLCKTRKQEDAFFIIMYGMELGLSPMAALLTIHVIEGKPSISGEAMLSLVRRSPRCKIVKITGDANVGVTVYSQRDDGNEYSVTWTHEKAVKAGLAHKANWQKHMEQMLTWRGVSQMCKMLYGDIVLGLYTVEEMSPDTQVNEAEEAVTIISSNVPQLSESLPTIGNETVVEDSNEPLHWLATTDGKQRLKDFFTSLGIDTTIKGVTQPYSDLLGVAKFSEFAGDEEALYAALKDVHGKLIVPAKPKKGSLPVAPPIKDNAPDEDMGASGTYISEEVHYNGDKIQFKVKGGGKSASFYGRTKLANLVGDAYADKHDIFAWKGSEEAPLNRPIDPVEVSWIRKPSTGGHTYNVVESVRVVGQEQTVDQASSFANEGSNEREGVLDAIPAGLNDVPF